MLTIPFLINRKLKPSAAIYKPRMADCTSPEDGEEGAPPSLSRFRLRTQVRVAEVRR